MSSPPTTCFSLGRDTCGVSAVFLCASWVAFCAMSLHRNRVVPRQLCMPSCNPPSPLLVAHPSRALACSSLASQSALHTCTALEIRSCLPLPLQLPPRRCATQGCCHSPGPGPGPGAYKWRRFLSEFSHHPSTTTRPRDALASQLNS